MDDMVETAGTKKKGMHRRVFEFLQADQFTCLVNSVNSVDTLALRNRLGLGAVVLTLIRLFLERMRDRLVSASLSDDCNALTKPESVVTTIKLQVKRFVGYGLSKLIQGLQSRVTRKAKEDDDNELLLELGFTRSLRIFHVEALTTPTYLANYYDKTQALTSNGYLKELVLSVSIEVP
jgi:hypothetical protein